MGILWSLSRSLSVPVSMTTGSPKGDQTKVTSQPRFGTVVCKCQIMQVPPFYDLHVMKGAVRLARE